jgi:Arc/MetJ family transcription regulator
MKKQKLINEAMKITGLKTEAEVIELSLKTLINLKKQEEIKQFKGKLK